MSLCSGYGGLDIGISLALRNARTICFIEREISVAAILAARFEDAGQAGNHGVLDPAPIWTDLRTFRGKPWRGTVDCIVAGYRCQPFSCAGKQQGTKDSRHLWPEVARIIREVQPEWVFLENVANHIRIGFRQVARELRRMGYRVEAGIFSAEEVGAPHIRQRLFALAHREYEGRSERGAGNNGDRSHAPWNDSDGCDPSLAHRETMDHTDSRRIATSQAVSAGRHAAAISGAALAHTKREPGAARQELHKVGQPLSPARFADSGNKLANSGRANDRRTSDPQELNRKRPPGELRGTGRTLADSSDRLLPVTRRQSGRRDGTRPAGAQLPVFCPGPDDIEAWKELLSVYPEVEPSICRNFNGGSPRVDRLRALGNGCVPLVVAHAFRTLRAAFDYAE